MTLRELECTLQDIKEDYKNGLDNRGASFYLMECELKPLIEEVIRYRKEKRK